MVAESSVGRADGPGRLTLIVLGGGPAQRHAIEAAVRLGIRPLVCDGSPGVGDAVVSSEDTEGVRRVARESGATGLIAPGTDWPVRIAAYVAEDLGLPHPLDVATAVRCTNKIAQREVLEAAGVPQPAWSTERAPGYPCVVKASDRQGQRAMTIVSSPDELEHAAATARAGARGGRALFEAFVPGPEVTVNAFSAGGRFHPAAVTARDHFDGAPGVARRHVYPSGLDDDAAISTAEAAVAALGIMEGPSYIQLIQSDAGPVIMEVAARLGGGHDSEICRRAAGVDLAGTAVSAAVGWTVDEAGLEPHPSCACVIEFLEAPVGVLVSATGPPEVTFYHAPGHRYPPLRTAIDRAGYVIALGSTREEALNRARTAVEAVRFEVE
jgi:cysteine synthase A